jgi:hypothetical protein
MCGETIMEDGGKADDAAANEENAADEDEDVDDNSDEGSDAGKRTTGTEWRLLDSWRISPPRGMTVAVSVESGGDDEPEAGASAGTMTDAGEAGSVAFEDEGGGKASSASSCSFTIASPPEGA